MGHDSTADYYNTATILDRNLEAGRGDKTAIRWSGQDLTYADLHDRTCRAAGALRALGVEREQRVLMVLDDSPAFPATFLGAMRIGAVPVPVNPMMRTDDYRYFLHDSRAQVAVVDAHNADTLEAARSGHDEPVELVVVGDDVPDGCHAFDVLLEQHAGTVDAVATHRDDMAFWLYSSGSTGRPKGVVHLHHDTAAICENYGKGVLGMTADDVTFSTTKLFHAYGLGNNLTMAYWFGATTVLLSGRPAPEPILETAEREQPTLFFSVPTLYNAMLNHSGSAERDLRSVRLCVSAAEALPASVWQRWKEQYDLTILDGIGSTEMLHIFCSNRPDDVTPGSSGKPVPGYELKLLDFEGNPVEQGETGNLFVKGDSAFAFYWRNHEKTKRTVIGEWIAAGDRYHMDDGGNYWYEGRSDDMMKVGGLWVSPVEIENTLVEHSSVSEAAVVEVEDDGFTRIKAFVTLRDDASASASLTEDLQAWCKDHLLRYQYPHIVEFVDELPKTATGKIQRFKLRDA